MAGLATARAWQTIKPHVPLIKFRKGGLAVDGKAQGKDARVSGAVSHAPAPPSGSGAAPQPAARVASGAVLEDYQLPPRYQRKLLDDKEIEYINGIYVPVPVYYSRKCHKVYDSMLTQVPDYEQLFCYGILSKSYTVPYLNTELEEVLSESCTIGDCKKVVMLLKNLTFIREILKDS